MALTKEKALYEGMYIISSTLSEDARSNALKRITDAIESKGGAIEKTVDQGRKKLAYQIDGRKDGNYYLLYFSVAPEFIADLWKEYHLNEDLLRFVTLKIQVVPETVEFKTIIEA